MILQPATCQTTQHDQRRAAQGLWIMCLEGHPTLTRLILGSVIDSVRAHHSLPDSVKLLFGSFPLPLRFGHELDEFGHLSDAIQIGIALEKGVVRKSRRRGFF